VLDIDEGDLAIEHDYRTRARTRTFHASERAREPGAVPGHAPETWTDRSPHEHRPISIEHRWCLVTGHDGYHVRETRVVARQEKLTASRVNHSPCACRLG